MSEHEQNDPSKDKQTSDPHGGISASGRTADEFSPDSQVPGDDYGNTGQEVVESDGS